MGRAVPSTHVTLTADAGLTGHDEAYADLTGLQPVAFDVKDSRVT